MEEFINYLCDNYFKADALFPPQFWNYHQNIIRIVDLTTNPLERINRRLKETCSTGHISFHKCCRTLHKFKTTYVKEYDFQITGNNLQNRRNSQTIARHQEILKILDQWSLFNNDCKSSFCISYFMKFGTVNVFQTYSPELSTDFQIPEDHPLVDLPLC